MIKPINETLLKRVYDFTAYTEEELRCKFIQKLEECICVCNSVSDIYEWIKEQGLADEVKKMFDEAIADGTIEKIINFDKYNALENTLTTKITTLETKHDNSISTLTTTVNNLSTSINQTVDAAIDEMETSVNAALTNQQTAMTNLQNTINTQISTLISETEADITELENKVNAKLNRIIYVGSETELQSALTSARTNPTKIYIYNSIKLNDIAFIPSNTHIEGLGNIIITVADSINGGFINYTTNNPSGYDGSENITIRNLTFDGLNRATGLTLIGIGHAKNIKIENCVFKNLHQWHMIELNACLNGQIVGCSFYNYGTIGENASEVIQLDSMISAAQFPWFGSYDGVGNENILIDSCYFRNIGNKCIGGHSFKQGSLQKNVTISNCNFYDVQTAVNINDFENLKVINNNGYSCRSFFISQCVNNSCVGLTIENNNVSGAGHLSTNLGDVRFITINPSGTLNNLNYYDVTITNNVVKDMPSHGIGITANNVTIANNKFNYVNKNGIYFYGGNMCTIIGNTFSDCGVEDNSRYAIAVGNNSNIGSVRVTISNNCVNNFRGIKIYGYSDVVLVTNNCVTNISSDLTSGYTEDNNILS